MQICIPKEGSYYLPFLSSLYGPFHDSGEPFEVSDTGEEYNSFHQGNSLYGENSVSHTKMNTVIKVNSFIQSSKVTANPQPSWRDGDYIALVLNKFGGEVGFSTFPGIIAGGTHTSDVVDSGNYYECIKSGSGSNYAYRASFAIPKGWWNFPIDVTIKCQVWAHRPIKRKDGSLDPYVVECTNYYLPHMKQKCTSFDEARALVASYEPSRTEFDPSIRSTTVSKWPADHKYSAKIEQALTWYRKFVSELNLTSVALPDVQSYGDLVQAACENVNPNTINAIAFLKDLKDVKELVPKLKKLGEIRTHASNYLGLNYGILPTIDDLKSIWDSFHTQYYYDRNGFQRASSYDDATANETLTIDGISVETTTRINRRIHLAINTEDTGLDALVERVRKLGVFPSLTNLWDLVPYSFVLDWFVDIGSVLERIDTRHQLFNLDIKYCIQSQKVHTSRSFTSDKEGLYVEMDSTSYQRNVGTEVPQPVIFKENRVTAQNHWVEGSALILARKPN